MNKLFAHRLFFPAVIVTSVALVFLPSLPSELLFDDERLRDGTIFGVYGGLFELKQRLLSWGSFVWVDWVFGAGWWKQRLVNIVIHAANALLLYHFLIALLRSYRMPVLADGAAPDGKKIEIAAGVGILLFSLNPVSVYAVAYLLQRSILMATFFSIACLFLTLVAAQRSQPQWLLGALLCYGLALLSKEHAVMLPGVAVALSLMVRRPSKLGAILSLAGMLVVAGIGTAFLIQRFEGTGIIGQAFDVFGQRYVQQLDVLSPGFQDRAYPLSILNQMWLFLQYGALWFIPNVMWMSLDLRPTFPLGFGSFPHILGLLIYLTVVGGALVLMIRFKDWRSLAGFALLAPALLYVTEFATIWVQDPFVLYRSYLWAAFGVPLLCSLGVVALPARQTALAAIVLSLVFSGLSLERILSLRTEATAWQDAADKIRVDAPANAVGRWRAFMNRGNQYFVKGLFAPALADYQTAQRLGATVGLSEYHRGNALQMMGRPVEALEAFEKAEHNPSVDFDLYVVAVQKANLLYQMGRFQEAVVAIDAAIPKLTDLDFRRTALTTRAKSQIRLGNPAAALGDYRLLVESHPNDRVLGIELASTLGIAGETGEAIKLTEWWLAERDGADVRFARAMILMRLGQRADALTEAQRALSFKPNDPSLQGLVRKLQSGG